MPSRDIIRQLTGQTGSPQLLIRFGVALSNKRALPAAWMSAVDRSSVGAPLVLLTLCLGFEDLRPCRTTSAERIVTAWNTSRCWTPVFCKPRIPTRM